LAMQLVCCFGDANDLRKLIEHLKKQPLQSSSWAVSASRVIRKSFVYFLYLMNAFLDTVKVFVPSF